MIPPTGGDRTSHASWPCCGIGIPLDPLTQRPGMPFRGIFHARREAANREQGTMREGTDAAAVTLRNEIAALHASTSWRATAPLRVIANSVYRLIR